MIPSDGQPAKRISVRVPVGEPWLELIEGSKAAPVLKPHPETLAEEVWQLVQEWYATRGEPIPEEDRTACMTMLEEEKVTPPSLPAPKPAYGTPEFWKAHWAKKRAAATAAATAMSTNPAAPVLQKHNEVPKAKPSPKTPAAKATARGGVPPGSAS